MTCRAASVARLLHVTPLGPADWIVIAGFALVPAVIGQGIKVIRGRNGAPF
jgi:hypothetical protein